MIVNENVLNELYESAGESRKERALSYVEQKRINIKKVIYEDEDNFEIRAKVRGNGEIYDVYIQVANGEVEDVSCTCEDYNSRYGTCKHILAAILEFNSNESYMRIFAGKNETKQNDIDIYKDYNKHEEKYRNFKQLISTFYPNNINEQNKANNKKQTLHTIKIEPTLIYNSYLKTIKLDARIGNTQLYKIKNFPEFYDRMQNKEYYKYGAKLEFVHEEDMFEKDSIPLLNFILKYSEIIKYANKATDPYSYYSRGLEDRYITLSNTGVDELFEVLQNKQVKFQKDNVETKILFSNAKPEIKFEIKEEERNDCVISPNIDTFDYDIIEGRNFIYFKLNDALYKCDQEFKNTTLKLLQVFRSNYTNQIVFPKSEMPQLFSVIFPKLKEQIDTESLNKEEIEKYVPKELFVKVYLDYNVLNQITADIKFVYGNTEFNPLIEQNLNIPRNLLQEDEVLELFKKTGFMLDVENARLILINEDEIYQFLETDIETYMKKFEVLATDSFKQKEIVKPKIENLGVRVENNLLDIDISKLDFDISELNDIMKKYHLKKKYHRLKDGNFLSLEENETMDFMDSISQGLDINFKEIEKGDIKLPIYRSLYLNKLLDTLQTTTITKNTEYQKLINDIEQKEFNENIEMPKHLNATLRNYQKVGYEWLKILDGYNFGGILADDMGLGKTIQIIAVILDYIQNNNNPKPSVVVCPSSLALNWQNEIKKFAPDLTSIVISGVANQRESQINSIPNYNIAITSYDLLKRDIDVYKQKKFEFQYIIADEAQYIKNNNTQNARAIKNLNSKTKFALTGTPIENSLSELWSIFDFIMPGYLFNYHKFKELFESPIVKEEDKPAMKKLKMLIEPFILRRIKTEVLTELPDKTITVLNNEMTDEQQKIYLSYLQNAKQEAMEQISTNGIEKSQIQILALLMRLRQICCHPSLFLADYKGESSKLNQCIEVIKDATLAGHKILLFSTYTAMFPMIEKELKKENIEYSKLTGQTKVGERIKLVDEFNENQNIKVFLISLKAGGTGLNLIGADMVIHYDPWWNLSAENQATDRTYRIGQKKNVQVYKLITKNSIEEKIYELQQRKAKLIDNMLSTKETFLNKLTKEEIMNLFN